MDRHPRSAVPLQPRQLRIEFPGALYHVTSRGNHRQDIFAGSEDRERFLGILAHTVRRHNWLCHAYCLMDNHYHLLIESPEGNLSKGMRQVGAVYTQAHNRRHNKSGHLFQGRYKAILVERESHLLVVIRHVLLNPVRTGAAKTPEAWPWSSYRGTCGQEKTHPCLSVNWVLAQFGRERKEAVRRFRGFVKDEMSSGSPFDNVKGQIALGGEGFLEMLAPLLEGKSAIGEIPRQQRLATRPLLMDLFAGLRIRKEIPCWSPGRLDEIPIFNKSGGQHGKLQFISTAEFCCNTSARAFLDRGRCS